MRFNKIKLLPIKIFFLIIALYSEALCSERDLEIAKIFDQKNPNPSSYQEVDSLSKKINNEFLLINQYIEENNTIDKKRDGVLEYIAYKVNNGENKEKLFQKYSDYYFGLNEREKNNSREISYLSDHLGFMMDKYTTLTGNKHFLDKRN